MAAFGLALSSFSSSPSAPTASGAIRFIQDFACACSSSARLRWAWTPATPCSPYLWVGSNSNSRSSSKREAYSTHRHLRSSLLSSLFQPTFLSRGPPLLFFRHLPCFYYTVLTAMLANDLARIASRTRVCKGRWRAGWRQWIRRRWAVAVRHSSGAARHGMVRDGKESGASAIGAAEGEMATKWRKDEDNGCRSDFGSGGDSGGGDDLWKCCGELSCLLLFLVSFVETERISTKSDSDRMDSVGLPNRSVRKVSTGPQLALR